MSTRIENVISKQRNYKLIYNSTNMEREEVFSKLNEIFEDVLDLDETPQLTDTTSANDIEEWDSLSHIQLIVAIEKAFKLKFTSQEILKWNNVGEMVDTIIARS